METGRMRRRSLALLLLLLLVRAGSAHPVPKDNHDRTLIIRLTPEAVLVDYRLEVDEYRATRDLPRAELEGVESREDFHTAFLRYHAGVLANNLDATLDGRELEFTCIHQRYQLLDHVQCDYRFRAPWKLAGGKAHRFTFKEGNYALDTFSLLHLSLDASVQLTLRDVIAPSESLLARPSDQRKPGDFDRLRKVSATVLAIPSLLPGEARSGLPPDPEPPRHAASRRWRRLVGVSKPVPSYPVGRARTMPPRTEDEPEPRPADEHHSLLHLLLDTHQGLAMLLLLAVGFGAAHALTPGHGKTLVAAYLIGQRGTVGHALVLGLTTTLTHTGGVILLAVFLYAVDPKLVQAVAQLVGGLLIAGLGLWLLMKRLAGQADHVHLGSGGGHSHGHEADAAVSAAGSTWGQVVLLGISGGIIPCWDAIAMLLLAISTQRLWLALPLLLAFSAGLAGVLVLLGIAVVRASAVARARMGDEERFQRWVRLLSLASAVFITALGLVVAFAPIER
jgi:ABC-type nickel/cobalt efflux system permease component RcnA